MTEVFISYTESEPAIISDYWAQMEQDLPQKLTEFGLHSILGELKIPPLLENPLESFSFLATAIALRFQTATGHRVEETFFLHEPAFSRIRCAFEHDDFQVGEQAAKLAFGLLRDIFEPLNFDLGKFAPDQSVKETFQDFEAFSKTQAQPLETSMLMEAARQQGVPITRLERGPYEGVKGPFRLRMNSMLALGHASKQQIIDGTFALAKSSESYPLLFDRLKVREACLALQMPVPTGGNKPFISALRARKAASQMGYPVVVKPISRRKSNGVTLNISSPEQIDHAVSLALTIDKACLLERFIEGNTWKLLIAGNEFIAILDGESGQAYQGEIDPSVIEAALEASRQLNVGMLELDMVTTDLSADWHTSGGAVVDIELAPRLDELLHKHPELMEKAAQNFVRWVAPDGPDSRIPIIAVTGTNGKTTTSKMCNHILEQAGFVTGIQDTDGRRIAGELMEKGDMSNFVGHYRIFENDLVQAAVLETHLRGIAINGFAFDWCDVGICTNVTPDHVGEEEVESVAEIADLKQLLVERAKNTAVLNADNEITLTMTSAVNANRTCLVSTEKTAEELSRLNNDSGFSCTLETRDDEEWIVINDKESAKPVVPAANIPAPPLMDWPNLMFQTPCTP
jgi:hypothetical protein